MNRPSAVSRRQRDLLAASGLLGPRLPRILAAVALGVLSLGSALALAGVSAWLITRAWQMPPVLDLSVIDKGAGPAGGPQRGVVGGQSLAVVQHASARTSTNWPTCWCVLWCR